MQCVCSVTMETPVVVVVVCYNDGSSSVLGRVFLVQ